MIQVCDQREVTMVMPRIWGSNAWSTHRAARELTQIYDEAGGSARLSLRKPVTTRAAQISRNPFKLAWPPLPTMMWSCTDIPSGAAISTMAMVIWISALDTSDRALPQAARTSARKRSTSLRSASDCFESALAAPSTWLAAAPVSDAARVTPVMLFETS